MRNDLKLEGIFLDNLRDVVTGKMPYHLSDVGSGKLWRKQPKPTKQPPMVNPNAKSRETFTNPLLNKSTLLNPAVPKAPVGKPTVVNPSAVKPPLRAPNPTFKKSTDGRFAEFDLNTPNGYAAYVKICQTFINGRNPNAGVTGEMMASAAKKALESTGNYVPPELALAQLAMEGGLSTNPNAIPIVTNNPYNIGNWDGGKRTPFPNKQVGINRYFQTMASDYLGNNRSAEDILQNFTNSQGNRYASATNYEQLLNRIVNQINVMKQSMA